KSQMVRPRFHSRGPRDVRDGRWSDDRRARGWSRFTSRSHTANPETLPDGRMIRAMGGGARADGSQGARAGSPLRSADPETLRHGRWLLAVGVVGATRARCPRWARLEARWCVFASERNITGRDVQGPRGVLAWGETWRPRSARPGPRGPGRDG